jgi:hypothetical protein
MKISSTLYDAGKNFARPTKYSAIITPPEGILTFFDNTLDVLCKSVTIPQTTNEVYEIKVKGHPVKLPKRSIQNQEVSMTFYVDEGYKVRQVFLDWIEMLDDRFPVMGENPSPNKLPIKEKYGTLKIIAQDFYETEITDDNKAPLTLDFENVFPTSVGDLTFDGSDKDNIHQLTVTFGYYRYITTLKND